MKLSYFTFKPEIKLQLNQYVNIFYKINTKVLEVTNNLENRFNGK